MTEHSHIDHLTRAESVGPARIAVVIVSDSRDERSDKSGPLIVRLCEEAGHFIVGRSIVPNDSARIAEAVDSFLASDAGVLVLSGGTGIGRRDLTVDVVRPRFEREIVGFGELFRWLSFQEIGSAALLSRATAGIIQGRLVVCLPGSSAAVRLALERLLLPQLRHLVWETVR